MAGQGEVYAVDLTDLPEDATFGEAIPVADLGEVYTVDLDNLPEGTVVGEAIAVAGQAT